MLILKLEEEIDKMRDTIEETDQAYRREIAHLKHEI